MEAGVTLVIPTGGRVGMKVSPHYQKRVCEICGTTSDQKRKVNISFLPEIKHYVCLKCKAEVLKLTAWNPFKGKGGDQTWWMPLSKNSVPTEEVESVIDVAFAWATDRLSREESLRMAFEVVLKRHTGQTKPLAENAPVMRTAHAPMRTFSARRRTSTKSELQLDLFL
ncbi:MAG: hypothetical protein M1378_00785 [Bacteroidetes bacterium]|nr:hypothetical protein [Bacteroidota bacterium]